MENKSSIAGKTQFEKDKFKLTKGKGIKNTKSFLKALYTESNQSGSCTKPANLNDGRGKKIKCDDSFNFAPLSRNIQKDKRKPLSSVLNATTFNCKDL